MRWGNVPYNLICTHPACRVTHGKHPSLITLKRSKHVQNRRLTVSVLLLRFEEILKTIAPFKILRSYVCPKVKRLSSYEHWYRKSCYPQGSDLCQGPAVAFRIILLCLPFLALLPVFAPELVLFWDICWRLPNLRSQKILPVVWSMCPAPPWIVHVSTKIS